MHYDRRRQCSRQLFPQTHSSLRLPRISPPPRWTNMKPAEKHFRCTICQRGFTRIDHLKRHHLRHSGQKPYSCVFCNESFARCDNLRDHYADCAQRGDRQIPETGQRGRRRHACQSCTAMKLRCDGNTPCESCVKRGFMCTNANGSGPNGSFEDGSSPPKPQMPPICRQPSDRGSIKFLLNGGTDTFTEGFRLPPRSDRGRDMVYHDESALEEASTNGEIYPYSVPGDRPDFSPGFVGSDPANLQFFQDTFLDFFNGPFGEAQKSGENSYTGQVAYPAAIAPRQDSNLALPADQAMFETERPFAMAMVQSILARAWTVPLDPKAQEEISANLSFLLTTARIHKFTSLYFKYWQPSCAMIHIPTFDPETVALPLLAAVTFFGAMYSSDQREAYVSKRLLDFAELFIFSSHIYSPESEVASTFSGTRSTEDEANDWIKFQNFQAGFVITIVQYWAGSLTSKNRAMENRFSEIVKVARRLNLVKARHSPNEEQFEEHLWIQTECRIRTLSIISLLDCAFFFYQNYPCRFTYAEIECELPCEEALFRSPHPFTDPKFRFTRDITVYGAFQHMFESPTADSDQESPSSRKIDLTVLDMFIVIHVLFAFINTHMTLVGLLKRQALVIQASQAEGNWDKSMIPEDSILGSIRTALNRWRDYWVALSNKVPSDEWASMGFYKNGYNFWLVSQLLITKKDAVDVIMQMEVHCEDKLEKLKVLLQDE
ncbi:uncharacterized protein N7482_005042 [Penicillium canariense]|uniref:C2H2 finger domain protein n=1 Tax=Penicillium canariense TaxID=189055 RepID=A0A9W9I357_9EURO|nr:uncharacterized protein N7482_005042 [Penicillium canariense]KAJ5166261.1 hypothetical protein N7482_005042 [Penicillium canariense]